MSEHLIDFIALDIKRWNVDRRKLKILGFFTNGDEEIEFSLEVSARQPSEVTEQVLKKCMGNYSDFLHKKKIDDTPVVKVTNEKSLRQKLNSHFKKFINELNGAKQKKTQPRLFDFTGFDFYKEKQDIGHLSKNLQFFVILNWARRHYEAEDFKKAIDPLRKAIKINPTYGITYKWLARSLKKIRRYEEAMRYYEKYREVDDSLDAWLELAKSYRKGKEFDKSEVLYKQILEKHPQEREAIIGLAQIKYARNEPDFILLLDKLFEAHPNWLKQWLKEEFNFRIYTLEKTYLTPVQAANFLGLEDALELTRKAFRNDIPSHFHPGKARLSFFKEELENWAMVMNRYKSTSVEIKTFPERVQNSDEEIPEDNGEPQKAKKSTVSVSKQDRPLTRVEQILMEIRSRKKNEAERAETIRKSKSD
jgi:tetratricopeptide (TPR) repeat protein